MLWHSCARASVQHILQGWWRVGARCHNEANGDSSRQASSSFCSASWLFQDCDKGVTLQVTPTNVDIASVAPSYHLYTKEEIEEVISRL